MQWITSDICTDLRHSQCGYGGEEKKLIYSQSINSSSSSKRNTHTYTQCNMTHGRVLYQQHDTDTVWLITAVSRLTHCHHTRLNYQLLIIPTSCSRLRQAHVVCQPTTCSYHAICYTSSSSHHTYYIHINSKRLSSMTDKGLDYIYEKILHIRQATAHKDIYNLHKY